MNTNTAKTFMGQLACDKNGYVILLAVLIMGAVTITSCVYLLLLGIASAKNSIIFEQSNKAKSIVNFCSNEALQQIRDNNSFTGTNTINLGTESCLYTVSSLGGNNRQIYATGTSATVVRRIKILTNAFTPKVNVSSWFEY